MELLERVITPPEVVLAPKEPHSTKKDHYGSIAGHWLTPEQTIGTVVSPPCDEPRRVRDFSPGREIYDGRFQARTGQGAVPKGLQRRSAQRQPGTTVSVTCLEFGTFYPGIGERQHNVDQMA